MEDNDGSVKQESPVHQSPKSALEPNAINSGGASHNMTIAQPTFL